eukprot:gene12542-14372_t
MHGTIVLRLVARLGELSTHVRCENSERSRTSSDAPRHRDGDFVAQPASGGDGRMSWISGNGLQPRAE